MSQLLDQLTRNITTTEVWLGLFFFLLLGVGLCLLGRGLGFAFHFDGWIPKIEWISNEALKPRSQIVLSLIGIGLFVPGLIGLNWLTSVTTLEVLMGLSEEEYARFRILEKKFNEEHEGEGLRIRSDNVEWPELVRRLKQERIDVIIFDMTRRIELLREGLLKPLDDRRRLIPSSINATLLDDMNFNKRLYFLPFRPNVRIGWWNSRHPAADERCASKFKWTGPTTWQDVKEFAECQPAPDFDDPSDARLGQYGVVLSANGAKWKAAEDGDELDPRSPPLDPSPPLDAALLLLEVLRTSGKESWDICTSWDENDEGSPLYVLRDIYKMASPRSSDTDWQTATEHMLFRHVALARNWSFSISTMQNSGELQNFHPHVAWGWAGTSNIFKITEQSLEKLKSEGVPDDILKKLKGMKDKEFRAGFKVTEQSLEKLKSEGVPDDILKKLKRIQDRKRGKEKFLTLLENTIGEERIVQYESSLLKHIEFSGEEEFLATLKDTIGNEQTDQYKSLILKYAKYNIFKFKITEQSLEKLELEGVPDEVLQKLKCKKDQEFSGEEEFLATLKDTIGNEQTDQYKSLILKYTKYRFRTLLGGDVIALPLYGRQDGQVDELLRFLISQNAQKILVEGLIGGEKGLTWPPMRFDLVDHEKLQDSKKSQEEAQDKEVNKPRSEGSAPNAEIPIKETSLWPIGDIDDDNEKCHNDSPPTGENATECARLHLRMARDAVRDAMLHAEPAPRFWSPEMRESFTSAFHALVSTEKEEDVASKLKEAAGLYCLAPGSEPPKDKQGEQNKKLDGFIDLRFEGYPNETWNDVLDGPKIRVKLVNAKDPRKAASYHTDLCVQLESDNLKKLQPIKIPAGFTSALSEPVPEHLFYKVKVKKGEAWAWEHEDPDADCEWKSKEEAQLVYDEDPSPSTVVVLPFTSLTFLVLGTLIGMFFEPKRQQCLLARLWKAVRAPFTSLRRGLQVVLFILVVLQLWFTLERLEYAKEVRQFFSDAPVQVWLLPLALLLGFVLEMMVEMVASSGVRRWRKGKVKTKTPGAGSCTPI